MKINTPSCPSTVAVTPDAATLSVLFPPVEDDKLDGTGDIDALRSMNLHYGINKVVNYGLHDEDGGKTMNPFFVTDTGFLRARIVQNGAALKGDTIYHDANVVNWDDLGDMNITSLFSQSNIVVVTNKILSSTLHFVPNGRPRIVTASS